MVTTLRPISKAGWRVQIDSYSGFFTSCSGLEVERDNEKVASGNSRYKVPVHGLLEIADVDLSKPYEDGDMSLIALTARSSREPLTITIQAVSDDVQETPIGQPAVLLGCVCIKAKGLETDRDDADATMVELSFTVAAFK